MLSSENGGSNALQWPPACESLATSFLPSRDFRKANGNRFGPRMQSTDRTRSSNAGKTQTVLLIDRNSRDVVLGSLGFGADHT